MFLVACTRLYSPLCRSDGPFVRWLGKKSKLVFDFLTYSRETWFSISYEQDNYFLNNISLGWFVGLWLNRWQAFILIYFWEKVVFYNRLRGETLIIIHCSPFFINNFTFKWDKGKKLVRFRNCIERSFICVQSGCGSLRRLEMRLIERKHVFVEMQRKSCLW